MSGLGLRPSGFDPTRRVRRSGLKKRRQMASTTLHFVGWVDPISGYVGFRFTQSNLHVVSSIVQCETQQWPILEPSPKIVNLRR